MKTVSRIELRWTDENGQEWGWAAKLDLPVTDTERVQDYAIKRLGEAFDEWRRG